MADCWEAETTVPGMQRTRRPLLETSNGDQEINGWCAPVVEASIGS